MWYEILPTFGIMFVALYVPSNFAYYLHKFVHKNPCHRDLRETEEVVLYLRDARISNGNPYDMKGLEQIPDEE